MKPSLIYDFGSSRFWKSLHYAHSKTGCCGTKNWFLTRFLCTVMCNVSEMCQLLPLETPKSLVTIARRRLPLLQPVKTTTFLQGTNEETVCLRRRNHLVVHPSTQMFLGAERHLSSRWKSKNMSRTPKRLRKKEHFLDRQLQTVLQCINMKSLLAKPRTSVRTFNNNQYLCENQWRRFVYNVLRFFSAVVSWLYLEPPVVVFAKFWERKVVNKWHSANSELSLIAVTLILNLDAPHEKKNE